VWFGFFALIHAVLILDGWARWDVQRFLAYEFVPEFGCLVRLEPGFGLANLITGVALPFSLALVGTSTDWAIRRLGASAWKFLHYSVYVIFWLLLLHTAYFLFIHYTARFHRLPPPPDWFRFPFLLLTLALITLQSVAFWSTVRSRRLRTISWQPAPPGFHAGVPARCTAAHGTNIRIACDQLQNYSFR
jgi:methionine sulfoxide reductase heme-binding subunit